MSRRVAQYFLLFVFGAILLSVSGCKTTEPDNSTVRPWNSPQGWEGGMPMMDQQHR